MPREFGSRHHGGARRGSARRGRGQRQRHRERRVLRRSRPVRCSALVGESGSGKTTAALALLGPRAARGTYRRRPRGRRRAGLLALDKRARRSVRGRIVSYVPQDPGVALNPARRIGAHLIEALEVHDWGGSDQLRRERVGRDDARGVAAGRPGVPAPLPARALRRPAAAGQHRDGVRLQAGGGGARRADHRARRHDAGARARDGPPDHLSSRALRRCTCRTTCRSSSSLADRVAVMYAGRLVEQGPAEMIFTAAAHPYTRQLLAAVPRIEVARSLTAIPGRAPSPGSRPPGCPFAAALRGAHRRVRGRSCPRRWSSNPVTRRGACGRRVPQVVGHHDARPGADLGGPPRPDRAGGRPTARTTATPRWSTT